MIVAFFIKLLKEVSKLSNERVLIIGVQLQKNTEEHFNSTIDELKSLSKTAGGEVIDVITQKSERIHSATYIGKGKVDEVAEIVDSEEIDLVVCNDELSPSQLRNLNDQLEVRIIDRSQLILDIFARRADTKEGKLQVELAQLQYMLPRLHGMGTILSRLGGGIGTRGPGETKLETDQRHIRRRIDDIKARLKDVVKQRDQYRERRKLNRTFQIAIVGYTNAGKSTIFNRLTDEDSLEEDLLFATLDPLTRKITLPSGFETLITDTVGFLQDLPTTLIAAFKSTLEEVGEADLIIHVVDVTHQDKEQQQETVISILKDLDATNVPILTVYNKRDKLTKDFIPTNHPYALISAYDNQDLDNLLEQVENEIKNEWEYFTVYLDPSEGKVMHQIERETIIDESEFDNEKNKYYLAGYMRQDHPIQGVIKEKRK